MDESDLEEIRKRRLTQLQSQYQENNPNNDQAVQEKQQQAELMRNSMLSQILDQAARARLNTLSLGKPEKGKMVENIILSMAQRGEIRTKLGEQELINILESINKQTSKKATVVKFDRRRAAMDSDDDL